MALRSDFQALCLLMFFLVSASSVVADGRAVFNVKKFGAVADGKTDNSRAFLNTWKEACKRKGNNVIVVPQGGKYYVRIVSFEGPCKGSIKFLIRGDIYAPTDESSHKNPHWIKFRYVDYLTISGGGKLYGGGRFAWPYKGCGQGRSCMQVVPHSLRLEFVKHASMSGITSIDSKDKHISIFGCEDVVLNKIRTKAPHDSPNTDGLHIAMSERIQVIGSMFETGDDCIAIFAGSRQVNVSGSFCGPGHGVSLGSMGRNPNESPITKINIRNCTFTRTDNGFRIKTWGANSYPTYASGITVQDVRMIDVRNPIIIDQNYCPQGGCDPKSMSQVRIDDVRLMTIWGISTTEAAVNLKCSMKKPCQRVFLDNINLHYRDPVNGEVRNAVSSCSYVNGSSRGRQVPKACI